MSPSKELVQAAFR